MGTYDALEFGAQLRYHRLRLGWSAQKLAALYSEFVGREDAPPSPTFIYRVESGETKLEVTRRVILASLVGMSLPTLAEETSNYIDVSEYKQALESYCSKWHQGTLTQDAATIRERTSRLDAVAFHAFGAEKKTLLELLGFYQILDADVDVWGGQRPEKAYRTLSSTIALATQEKLPMLLVHARSQRAGIVLGRFETTKDPESMQTAIDDYTHAAQEEGHLSPFYRGLLHVRKGVADAYIARDQTEFLAAIRLITQGSHQIGSFADDVRIVARLDYERYMLQRVSACLYSPMGNPGLALAELQELDRWCPQSKGNGRLTQRNFLFAEAYLATKDYPMAASHLEAALETVSRTEIDRLVAIHTRLRNTSYWNDPDIGRIAVKINQRKYPGLFR